MFYISYIKMSPCIRSSTDWNISTLSKELCKFRGDGFGRSITERTDRSNTCSSDRRRENYNNRAVWLADDPKVVTRQAVMLISLIGFWVLASASVGCQC